MLLVLYNYGRMDMVGGTISISFPHLWNEIMNHSLSRTRSELVAVSDKVVELLTCLNCLTAACLIMPWFLAASSGPVLL